MSAKKPQVYWRRGHRYVRIQVELTEKQWQWLHDLDRECQVGLSGHIRFAVLQYRARIKQQQVELAKRLGKQPTMNHAIRLEQENTISGEQKVRW